MKIDEVLTDQDKLLIHQVIHRLVNPHNGVNLHGAIFRCEEDRKGLRHMLIGSTLWIAQNPNKTNSQGNLTVYALAARAGSQITWGIRDGAPWALIENGHILRP